MILSFKYDVKKLDRECKKIGIEELRIYGIEDLMN